MDDLDQIQHQGLEGVAAGFQRGEGLSGIGHYNLSCHLHAGDDAESRAGANRSAMERRS